MALCSDCTARIEYEGTGRQNLFTFPFEYDDISEVHVSVYDPEKLTYVPLEYGPDWGFNNPTTIGTRVPPTENIVIYRCTDIGQMKAVFHPGHPIKAGDLNDDFNQLKNAIEEAKCATEYLNEEVLEGKDIYLNRIDADDDYKGIPGDLVKSTSKLCIDDEHVPSTKWVDGRFWDHCDETTYRDDDWLSEIDDCHIPTTAAVEQRLADFQALSGVKKVTGNMQREQKWDESVTDDDHVATTDALVERFDQRLSETGGSGYWLQPGKLWVKDDTAELFYRRESGTQWIQLDTKGDQGDQGVPGSQGDAATIEVGTTTTGLPGTDALVENVGTNQEAIFNFTIPRGEPGPEGPPGGGGGGETLTFTAPLVKTGTTVSIDLLTLSNTP